MSVKRPLFAALAVIGFSGCAPSLRVLVGRVEGQRYAMEVLATCQGPDGAVHLKLENKTDEPVGLELDALLLREPDGKAHRALGRVVKKGSAERVPYGAALIDPHGRIDVEIEFDRLPQAGDGRMTLVVPRMFQLGIEGEQRMPSVEVRLAYDKQETAAAERAAFHDPFVED